jgi:uncharacterized protein
MVKKEVKELKLAIAGGTGFIGKAIADYFLEQQHEVLILTRNVKKHKHNKNLSYVEWLNDRSQPEKSLEGVDVLINLAGEAINSGRWTRERKQKIVESRVIAAREAIQLLSKLEQKPRLFINASAVGIYGTSLTKTFTEDSSHRGDDFLAQTVMQWENEAEKTISLGIRTVLARFGVVLGEKEGALPRIVLPYKWWIGGTIGSGEQWLSWIHIKDVSRIIEFLIKNDSISGPVNFTSPHPSRMREFGQTIGKVLGRPHWLPVPNFSLKLLLGEMSMLVLEGQKVLPEKLQNAGFEFSFSHLEDALIDILK